MEGRQRRSFTDDYKRQAVDLLASSGRSIGSVAKELGLRDSVLQAIPCDANPAVS
jgi:transposase